MNRRLMWLPMLALLLTACARDNGGGKRPLYTGPTKTLEEVVAAINANNSRVPTLWADHYFEADIIDPKTHEKHFVNGSGALLYASPNSLRLTAKKEVTDLFDMGTDGNQFWFRLVPDENTIWWGHIANVNKPGAQPIPIRPDLVLQVLGVSQINHNLTAQPVPVMRFNPDADAYMLVWQTQSGDKWVAEKEIWYDRATLRPMRVILFDNNARVLVRANLGDYQAVETSDVREQWPVVPTTFGLFFPDSGSKMNLKLGKVSLSHNGFPKAVSFRIPDINKLAEAGVKVNQIDADCAP